MNSKSLTISINSYLLLVVLACSILSTALNMSCIQLLETEMTELADFGEEESNTEKEETKKEKEVDEYVHILLAEHKSILEQEHYIKSCFLAILDSHLEVVTPPPEYNRA